MPDQFDAFFNPKNASENDATKNITPPSDDPFYVGFEKHVRRIYCIWHEFSRHRIAMLFWNWATEQWQQINYIPADSSLWRSPAFRKARAPQNVWSVQDNLSYNVSGHNFWSTTNWAIIYYRAILTVVVITRGPGEKIVVFLTVFCSPILKSSKSQPVEGQDQLLFTKPWRISPTCLLYTSDAADE